MTTTKSAGRPARAGHLSARVVREAWEAAPMTARRLWRGPRHPLLRIELWADLAVRPVDVYRLRAGSLACLLAGACDLAKWARSDAECSEWVDVCDLLLNALNARPEGEWYEGPRWETVRRQHAARLARRCSLVHVEVSGWRWLAVEERRVRS